MKRFVYKENYAKLLISMREDSWTIEQLSKNIGQCSQHMRTVFDQWHKEQIIHKIKGKRDYKISLTQKGLKISEILAQLLQVSGENDIEEDNIIEDYDAEEQNTKIENQDEVLE